MTSLTRNVCGLVNFISRFKVSFFVRGTANAMSTGTCSGTVFSNRLKFEKSPYLLQHASNPVEWYPWGEDAFKAAKEQNKLIFLSIGYSTCHWCHVMERESFENEEIAKIMNKFFISIKVDREERPDVDKVYMTFVTASSGSGGWPMSVFLTPTLVPVAGGTYFPPKDTYGRPGFITIMNSLAQKWKTDKNLFETSGSKIMQVLEKTVKIKGNSESSLPTEESFSRSFSQLKKMYEPTFGGFSQAPKFPQPSNLNFLFTYRALYPNLENSQTGVDMALRTLDMMDKGGIHDHVSQGFARYSTDRKWHVPHFEKMLYDQAQLVMAYLDAFLLTKDQKYAEVVRDILTYVMRDLSHPNGGFYSAEDADSYPTSSSDKKREGAFCVWTHEEIVALLNETVKDDKIKLSQIFSFHFSVVDGGNIDPYTDPHNELKDQNVLISHGSIEETASEFDITIEECSEALKKSLKILYDERQKRPRPHLDDKMLTAWNGMMLAALARAGSILNDSTYTERALKNAEFIVSNLWKGNFLLRAAYKEGDDGISLGSEKRGFADDYSWMIRGFIHLYNATLDEKWLKLAEEFQERQNELFWDFEGDGGYFLGSKDDASILLRMKDDQDGAEPSINSVSSGNLTHLSRLINRPDYGKFAESIFKLFSDRLEKVPVSLPEMTKALILYSNPVEQIILSGRRSSLGIKQMLAAIHGSSLNPNRVILIAEKEFGSYLYGRHESLLNYAPKGDEELAYLCKNFTCSLPVKTPQELIEKMVAVNINS